MDICTEAQTATNIPRKVENLHVQKLASTRIRAGSAVTCELIEASAGITLRPAMTAAVANPDTNPARDTWWIGGETDGAQKTTTTVHRR
jgi:hypothetical protein